MPISYRIFPEFDLVVTKYAGLITDEVMLDSYREIYRDVLYRPGKDELVSLIEVSAIDIELETIIQLVELTLKVNQGAKTRSAVLSKKAIFNIMAKLYQSIADLEGTELIGHFEELPETLEWLGRADFPVELLEEVP